MRNPRRISRERQGVYTAGLALSGLGGLGFFICFIGFATSGFSAVGDLGVVGGGESARSPFGWFIGAAFCVAAITAGQMMRRVGARGVAGSGLVLDPERARRDLEPFARMGGGLVRDALDETGLLGQDAPTTELQAQIVKIRCGECRTLNEEDARFCDQCGAKL